MVVEKYSVIGLGECFVCFSEKKVNFDFLRFDFAFFKLSSFRLLKGKQTLLLNSNSVKIMENVIGF